MIMIGVLYSVVLKMLKQMGFASSLGTDHRRMGFASLGTDQPARSASTRENQQQAAGYSSTRGLYSLLFLLKSKTDVEWE
jgi:hypothetical protein